MTKKIFLSAFVVCFTIFYTSVSKAHEISDNKISFSYTLASKEVFADCTHKRKDQPHDWSVQCKNSRGHIVYETDVHLIMRQYYRTEADETGLEFHFWTLNDSTSVWLTQEDGLVKVKRLLTYLGVKDESAFLRLEILL